MSFAYPGFLWALFSLAIPVIIHLFNFRRVQRIFFSNTRLLKQVKDETTKRRRIKHWLILLSRLLFLLFLVLAFAQPYFPASEQFSSGKNIVIYVDNSYSLSAPMVDKSRALDVAIGLASEIINTFPQSTRYKLLTNDFAPFSNNYKTKVEVTDLLAQVRFSNISRSMEDVQKKIESTGKPDIFFLSDFQKSTLGVFSINDTIRQWRLVPIQSTNSGNIYVDSAWFENPYLLGGEKNRLHVIVRNDGNQNADHLSIKLTMNNVLAATATLAIPGNGSTASVFDISASPNEYQELKISLQDFPISFDNEFYLAFAPLQPLKIVEVRGTNASQYVKGVYGNRQLFEFKSYPATNIDFPQLEAADLTVFNELSDFDEPLRQLIALGKIKSYFVIPSRQIKVSSYQTLLGLAIQPLGLPAGKPEPKEKLSVPDFRNPFFQNVFEDKSPTMEMPTALKAFQWGNDPSAILKLRDGSPFLSKTRGGFVMATPLQSDFTDFAQHALFVPVMYKMAALGKQDLQRPYYFLSENFLSIPSDSLATEEPVKLTGAKEIIPSQRYVAGRIFMDVPKLTLVPGFSYITTRTDTLGLLAFNLTKDESRMEVMLPSELKKMAGDRKNISVFEPGSRQAFGNEIKARYLGEPLWKYCLAMALLFILVEILLIRFWK
jgi:Aerotolerance regulator N-terminal